MNVDYAEYVKTLSNDELIEKLKYCGYDSYYKDLYQNVIPEIRRRMERQECYFKKNEIPKDCLSCAQSFSADDEE